jgi:hypothetical protein
LRTILPSRGKPHALLSVDGGALEREERDAVRAVEPVGLREHAGHSFGVFLVFAGASRRFMELLLLLGFGKVRFFALFPCSSFFGANTRLVRIFSKSGWGEKKSL